MKSTQDNMEKNPISLLQEYMMIQTRALPNYILVEQTVGTHVNSFRMRVECNGRTAEGFGRNKKEAKTNCAINMLKLLELYPNQSPSSPNSCNNNDSITNSDCQNDLLDPPSPGINYIGKLQEMTAHKSTSPIYRLKSVSGPPHNYIFTYTCKFEDKEEEATSKTKKEAKSLSAKKMLERISNNFQIIVPEEKCESYLDTIRTLMHNSKLYEENKNSMINSASKALEYYPQLNKSGKKVLTDNRSYNEYHTFLKNTFSTNERQSAINQLQEAIKLCENSVKRVDEFVKPKNILCAALNVLSINMSEVGYLNVKGHKIYGLKLLTNPVISEIGYGIDNIEAENMAIYEIAKTLTIMLL